jgi:hypothetical protein
LRHRIDVVAPTTVRVVQFSGGWLFDRVMAGCEVTVHVADHADSRALQILGARVVDLARTLATRGRVTIPHTLAVDADLLNADDRVRLLVREAAAVNETELRLWGDACCPAELDREASAVCHRLSLAARAFKAHALAAADAPTELVDLTETFRSKLPVVTDTLDPVPA